MKEGAKKITRVEDCTPDALNANRHTQRGMSLMETSLRECGYGDSITCDRFGRVISGNGRVEVLADIQMMDAIVVQSDGTRPVIHQRTDLDLEQDERAKKLALLQNRVGQVNLEWDSEVLAELAGEGIDLSGMWTEEEIASLFSRDAGDAPSLDATPPDDFKEYDETIETEHTCPKCGYAWSGGK